jgi:hypothetical protein
MLTILLVTSFLVLGLPKQVLSITGMMDASGAVIAGAKVTAEEATG